MTTDQLPANVETGVMPVDLAISAELHYEISQFLVLEARLLDERRFDDWVALFADDVRYWMPIRYNKPFRELSRETSRPGEPATFEETKKSLGQRVWRLKSGMAWAEDPPSRTRHLVTNVWARPTETADEFDVDSYFLVYRNRGDSEVDIWAGRREDVLRRVGDRTWQVGRRTIILDQATILAKNLSVFF